MSERGSPAPTSTPRVELERTLGLREAFAIGLGTMIGAGIFVFPGLAAGNAGPAAVLSFAIGAGIALLVALPASELATAMPESGGGYQFVSRSLGTLAGCVVGIAQWLGLIFASAFYLVGFGHYVDNLLTAAEIGSLGSPTVLGFAAAVGLTVVSILGTRNTGRLQNVIVGVLVVVLAGFLGHSTLDAVGIIGQERIPEVFAPHGYLPVLTTAALVFTSYLGFAQVAAVAGDIRDPGRTLPLAMVGSVVVVGLFYVLTIFVSTSVFGSARMAELGETAVVEVARSVAGPMGALVILLGGVLATLSSANASILGSSRSVFALSRDGLVPDSASRMSERFRTPHWSILLAGIPVAALALVGRIEVLAEVASFLHLVMYGLICVSMLVLRHADPDWYQPTFRAPGHPVVPVLGALASFGLMAFMDRMSIILGVAIVVAAGGWYAVYGRRRLRVVAAEEAREEEETAEEAVEEIEARDGSNP